MKYFYIFTIIVSCHGEFYKPEQRNNVIRGKIILQKKQPSTLSCIHKCKFKRANGIYENGVCTCVKEEEAAEDITEMFTSSTNFWKQENTICSTRNPKITLRGLEKECYCNDSKSGTGRIKCQSLWTLIASNVCYEGKGSAYGAFQFNQTAELKSLKLEHVSGLITCSHTNPNFGSSIWTCNDDVTQLSTFVTGTNNTIIFPPGVTLRQVVANIIFADKNVFKMTPKTLTFYGPTISVSVETELRIWNANDLGGNNYDKDNRGRHCVNVYGRFEM